MEKDELRWAELDTGVEQATKVQDPSKIAREAYSEVCLDVD